MKRETAGCCCGCNDSFVLLSSSKPPRYLNFNLPVSQASLLTLFPMSWAHMHSKMSSLALVTALTMVSRMCWPSGMCCSQGSGHGTLCTQKPALKCKGHWRGGPLLPCCRAWAEPPQKVVLSKAHTPSHCHIQALQREVMRSLNLCRNQEVFKPL